MGTISVRSEGGDRFEVNIRGHRVVVDQPLDARGTDAGPTPTELFVASLGACVAFYVGRFVRRHGVPEEDVRVLVAFRTSEEAPHRVSQIDVELLLPEELPKELREPLLRVAQHCTVHNSLRWPPAVRTEIAPDRPLVQPLQGSLSLGGRPV